MYRDLDSSPRGLSDDEAAARLARCGPNELPRSRRRPVVLRFGAQFTDLFAVVLMVAAGITLLAYAVQSPREVGNLQLAVAILAVVVMNAVIGFVQEYSAERTVQALQAMVPGSARVLRDGERTEVPVPALVPGDVVVLEAGDAVSADCRLVEVHTLSVNNMALTGESEPVGRTGEAADPALHPLDARNCVFMGTTVAGGTGKGVVYATGSRTEFGRVVRLTAEVRPERSPLQRQMASMARRVSAAALGTGALLFVVRAGTGGAVVTSFLFALGVMVALVPEGLPATLSVSLAIGVRRMARHQALIKKLVAVETLGATTVICTDKTGTLTKAEMTAQVVWASGRPHAISGVGYAPVGDVEDASAVRKALRVAALCSDARLLPPGDDGQGWRVLGDTTEGAILVAAAKAGVDLAEEERRTPRVAEFPFDSARKLMSTVHRVDGRLAAYVKGSPQELLT
ncbi:MAG TPA: HAD-IC family P-type ATPase, partial [Frankiaceae bacterium]|nr:HAD-IC family P-type ATPase [Frankiaceae bacterium]